MLGFGLLSALCFYLSSAIITSLAGQTGRASRRGVQFFSCFSFYFLALVLFVSRMRFCVACI